MKEFVDEDAMRVREDAARELERFKAILAAGGVAGVHPSTWLRILAYAQDVGTDLGGISVRVSLAFPRDQVFAIAAPAAAADATRCDDLPMPFLMGRRL